ncbi:MAG TPA: dihydrolipoamide acetyltransferase family protein [Anaeromyxobacter sp.]|nr:dihydrolipoamide acetyltransferase family protein [Anaeromyxobacter sp.]
MAHVLVMPRQGNTVESCVLVAWKVAEGATVAEDQVVCEVETDKATFEVPAGAAGVLLKRLRAEGDDVPVMEPIGVIGRAGEDWKKALEGGPQEAAAAVAAAPSAPAGPATAPATGAAAPAAAAPGDRRPMSPRARRLAREQAVDPAGLPPGSGPGGRVIERDVRTALAARPPLTAAARAEVAAGTPVPSAGSALGGRVGAADLAAPAPAPAARAAPSAGGSGYTEAPLRSIRKIIAERMKASLQSTAQLTFHGSAPAARILALRERFKGSDPALGLTGVTIGDLVMYAAARVVRQFPALNSHLIGGTLRTFERVHLGFAVDTPRGLMVPVVRNADGLSLAQLSAETKRLATACQGGAISPDDLAGATFTVSNLGALGVESFTPVLNAPEVGILGVSAVVPRAAAGPDGALVLEKRMGLSLTVDHQVIDGAPAARILQAFCAAIADVDLVWAQQARP